MTMTMLDATALEHQLAQLPPLVDDPAYLVFADWLQSRGHPWGELVALQHAAATAPTPRRRDELAAAAEKLLQEHARAILGELPPEQAQLVWHLGFVRSARLVTPATSNTLLAAVRALLRLPVARMLESLILDPRPEQFTTNQDWSSSSENIVDPWPDWDELGPLLHERVPHLGFGGWPAPAAAAYVQMPSFDIISRWLRGLRRLELTGSWRARREILDLPELVDLEVRFADASDAALDALAASKLPALERCVVWLGGSSNCILDDVYPPADRDDDDEDQDRYPPNYSAADLEHLEIHGVRTAISGKTLRGFVDALPPLVTELGLPSSRLSAELIELLVRSPRIATLRRLDLSGSALGDDAARALLGARAALARIGVIDLARNQITSSWTSQLTAALPNVNIGEQGQREPDFFFRYVATME